MVDTRPKQSTIDERKKTIQGSTSCGPISKSSSVKFNFLHL